MILKNSEVIKLHEMIKLDVEYANLTLDIECKHIYGWWEGSFYLYSFFSQVYAIHLSKFGYGLNLINSLNELIERECIEFVKSKSKNIIYLEELFMYMNEGKLKGIEFVENNYIPPYVVKMSKGYYKYYSDESQSAYLAMKSTPEIIIYLLKILLYTMKMFEKYDVNFLLDQMDSIIAERRKDLLVVKNDILEGHY